MAKSKDISLRGFIERELTNLALYARTDKTKVKALQELVMLYERDMYREEQKMNESGGTT